MKPENKFLFWDYLILAGIVSAILLESIYTIHQIGVSWDEPFYFEIVRGYADWFRHLGKESFSESKLEQTFGVKLFGNAHPCLAKFLATITYLALKKYLGEFWAYRFYAPILFALLLALIYFHTAQVWGRLAGIFCVIFIFFMPRVFADGHIGATESPLMFFWYLTTFLFMRSFSQRSFAVLAGISFGLVMSVKFTGFLIPLPLLVWAILFQRKKIFYPALCLFLIGPLVFLIFQPFLWYHPIKDLGNFIHLSIARQTEAKIPVYFFGKGYHFSAPWYYAPVMVLITVPVFTLFFFLLGMVRTFFLRRQNPLLVMSFLQFWFFILTTMLPNVPTYDGVRLFIPAFIFLGLIAGFGFAGTMEWFLGKFKRFPHLFKSLASLLLFFISSYPLIQVYPFGLEYYNEIIGGVSGAKKYGMETTYWFTVINPEALERINQLLPPGAPLRIFPTIAKMGELYQEQGWLRKDVILTKGNDAQYFLILSRPYWDFEPIFLYLGVSLSELEIIADQKLDGVPLWVLYKKKTE